MLFDLAPVKSSKSSYDSLFRLTTDTLDVRFKVLVRSNSCTRPVLQGLRAGSFVRMPLEGLNCLFTLFDQILCIFDKIDNLMFD